MAEAKDVVGAALVVEPHVEPAVRHRGLEGQLLELVAGAGFFTSVREASGAGAAPGFRIAAFGFFLILNSRVACAKIFSNSSWLLVRKAPVFFVMSSLNVI